MSAAANDTPSPALRLAVAHAPAACLADALARPDTLAVFGFGANAPSREGVADPRYLRVPLRPLGEPALEVWRGAGDAASAFAGGIAHADDGELQFGAVELRDADADDMLAASERAYAKASAFWKRSGFPHLLRIWNYFDEITWGEGDDERYRQFCVGRARGLGAVDTAALPAATAIGCRGAGDGGGRVLQVYWLAARRPGTPLENPRQTSAWRYPREYGPQSPSFARALLPPAPSALPLFVSGTASIVGHASRHVGSLPAQLDETLANLDSLLGAARAQRPSLPPHFDASSRLKVYVRDAAQARTVEALLRERLGDSVPRLLLHGDVCRRELQVEIEGMHGLADGGER
jgi:chorismate lyase/3-hydroxybenzoate synthase